MPIAPSREDHFQIGRRHITARPSKLTRAVIDTPGSTARLVVGAAASMCEEVSLFADQAYNATRISTAAQLDGDELDRAVFDRFGQELEPRRGATVARVYVEVSRPATGIGLTLPAGRTITGEDSNGVTFELAEDLVVLPSQTGPIRGLATCQTAGIEGNVPAGTLTVFSTEMEDPTLVVTNPQPAAGGLEAETKEAFAARSADFWAGARRATKAAVALGAKSTAGVTDAVVTELLDPNTLLPAFRARVVIAGDGGQANDALAELVADRLEEFRPLGVPVPVTAGQPVLIAIRIEGVQFVAGGNTSRVKLAMQAAIAARVNEASPGEPLFQSVIMAAMDPFKAKAKVPLGAIVEPAGDLEPATPQTVIQTRPELIEII